MVNKHTLHCHPSPSELISRIHPLIFLIFLWTQRGLISPEYFLNFFLKLVYPTMVAEKFHIYGVKITGKYIFESKNLNLFILSPSKAFPQLFIITMPGRRKLSILPKQRFLKIYFSLVERREDYGAEKMTKIKLARELVTSFDKFHHFSTFTFLVSVLLYMLKCEGSLTSLIFTKNYCTQE